MVSRDVASLIRTDWENVIAACIAMESKIEPGRGSAMRRGIALAGVAELAFIEAASRAGGGVHLCEACDRRELRRQLRVPVRE